jgi:RimJ/RimL family protein N-acetyltransferase
MPDRAWVEPVVLEGRTVRLEPLAEHHAASLAAHAELDLFQFFATVHPAEQTAAGVQAYIRETFATPAKVAFAIVLRATGEAVGSTSYMDIQPANRALEIGSTWIGRAYQGTQVNPECKLLMLTHAFEVLGASRVQLKTDGRNLQSQAAMRKLGLTYEGTLRRNIVMVDGHIRDTVMFSAIPEEWPALKAKLIERLGY